MNNIPVSRLCGALVFFIVSFSAYAHHTANVVYDPTQIIEIQGVVKEFLFRSPHSSLKVEVTDPDGTVHEWLVETHAVPTLTRAGMKKDTFKPGDTVSVTAWPNRNPDTRVIFGVTFVTQDGDVIGRPVQPPPAEGVKAELPIQQRISGRWNIPFPKTEKMSPLPLSQAGLDAWHGYDRKLSPANTCEPTNVPSMFYVPYLYDIRIGDKNVITQFEVYQVTRTIPLGSALVKAEESGLFGRAAARIEDDTLMIESSDFPASRWGLGIASGRNGSGADVPSSQGKKLTERYSVSSDGQTLTLKYTLEDPVYLTKPYTDRIQLRRVNDSVSIEPFDCVVDSATIFSREKEAAK